MTPHGKYGYIFAERKEFPADEPIFLLRAQDKLAPEAVAVYAALLRASGLEDTANEVEDFAATMIGWQSSNPEKVKLPD